MKRIIDEKKINLELENASSENSDRVREILAKALEFKGLSLEEAAQLTSVSNDELLKELFVAANKVKEEIYGKRVVIFAPLYISNLCSNECLYCAFRSSNKELKRRFLNSEEIVKETEILVNQGHKRVLMVAGETYPGNDFKYVLNAIDAIYSVKSEHGVIRRINVNLAPLGVEDFRRLKDANIGTYQLFQETYHRESYKKVHIAGKKADYDWRITVFDRALSAGIDDIGIGALFGLYDWRFELLAILQHSEYLQENFGVGPHTISVPRIEPAFGSEIASNPLSKVTDLDFCKLVAILRLAVPYTGIIMSTRENSQTRKETLALGVSQISAGSCTNPGGYSDNASYDASQFSLGDHRSLDQVICDIARLGYMPSFCTACYRLGRTGEAFMDLAKSGKIKTMCAPNAISTFAEYLNNHGSPETKLAGEKVMQSELESMDDKKKKIMQKLLGRTNNGEKDVYV